jgi:hypothetical protein
MTGIFQADVFSTFLQVILIDLVLAGDNPIVIPNSDVRLWPLTDTVNGAADVRF